MSAEKPYNYVLHLAMTPIALLPVAATPHEWWAWVVSAFAISVLREDAQHRPSEGWSWPIRGWRRWVDIACGAAGGVAAWAIARFAFGG